MQKSLVITYIMLYICTNKENEIIEFRYNNNNKNKNHEKLHSNTKHN